MTGRSRFESRSGVLSVAFKIGFPLSMQMCKLQMLSQDLFCDVVLAHVALTYPPARKYDLDFLDNSRTKGPCGMPKGCKCVCRGRSADRPCSKVDQ
uniref:Uncharacterized protein n=1 Tax=Timema genevievae TaxID=629358 RepID=A0A7R9JTN7_TIMGE|nr:unnamed protein product [Timema genevievae]